MQTLILSDRDYEQIAKMAKRDYHEDFQIDFEKNGCVLSIQVNHILKHRNVVGASFMGLEEQVSECVTDVYEVVGDVSCLNGEDVDVCHDFNSDRFCNYLN